MKVFLSDDEQHQTYMRLFLAENMRIRIWLWNHDFDSTPQFIDLEDDSDINELISELQKLLTIKNKNNG